MKQEIKKYQGTMDDLIWIQRSHKHEVCVRTLRDLAHHYVYTGDKAKSWPLLSKVSAIFTGIVNNINNIINSNNITQ